MSKMECNFCGVMMQLFSTPEKDEWSHPSGSCRNKVTTQAQRPALAESDKMRGCYQLQTVIPKRTKRSAGSLERGVRPRRIIITYTDPFDDTMLAQSDMPYEPRRAATGFYTRYVSKCKQMLKQIQSHILEGRDPKVTIEQVA